MTDLASLKSRFAGAEGVRFLTAAELGYSNDGSRACVAVENRFGRIVVALNGAHVMSWVPAGKADVLWMSPLSQTVDGKPIRGGIPLCTPWFGPGGDGLPLHGWARIVDWTLEAITPSADDATTVVLALPAGGQGGPGWSVDFDMRLTIELGAALKLGFAATNRGGDSKKFEFAFHTYFAVGDVAKATVTGLENCRFFNRLDGSEGVEEGVVRIAPPLTHFYLDPPTEQVLASPAGSCRVTSQARAAVVWNPGAGDANVPDLGAGAHRGFLCLERADAAERAVTLAPGASYGTEMTLTAL